MRIERVVLEDHRDVALGRRELAHRTLVEEDLALAHLLDAGDHLERRGLAAAGRSEQAPASRRQRRSGSDPARPRLDRSASTLDRTGSSPWHLRRTAGAARDSAPYRRRALKRGARAGCTARVPAIEPCRRTREKHWTAGMIRRSRRSTGSPRPAPPLTHLPPPGPRSPARDHCDGTFGPGLMFRLF